MKITVPFLLLTACLSIDVWAQQVQAGKGLTDDPILMVVDGKPVLRSEFEYSFRKNSQVQGVSDRKSVREYLPMFIDYKLKVAAAEAAHLDTLSSFKREFATYRDMQLTPFMVDSAYIDSVAHVVYDNTVRQLGGKDLIEVAHILLRVGSKDNEAVKAAVQVRADSIYTLLKDGGDFSELARRFSQDPVSAAKGGILPLAGPGSFVKEFEDAAYALKSKGDFSHPILSPFGYHIIKMIQRKPLEPFEAVKPQIMAMLKRQGIDEASSEYRIKRIVEASKGRKTREVVLDSVMNAHVGNDTSLRCLVQEYHDGLLLYEVSKRQVWDVAQSDTLGLERWYKEHRSDYSWNTSRFKGYVFHARTSKQAKAVKKILKKVFKAGGDWRKTIHKEFNVDSVCVKVSGPYLCGEGENAYVDAYAFKKKGGTLPVMKGFPFSGVYGKIRKQPQSWLDVKPQVTADYQNFMEKAWVDSLHKRFTYTVNESVLDTVKP